ncbi:putative Ig domain-containing protein [Geothrix sp.]|uniref:putative Ig domain-containing protein n=1 Tax=Geothrix sp. TaxID=1962974 RepID=UPI0026095385|nr:putative Ig domain-containing protein [Geothrix sp.]WIL20292.1 MAG: putative Ig domain-containing protein [Geothrix sp.]
MSIHSLRQRSGRILLALSMGLGLAALHTGCASNPSSYKDPAPAISSFLACKDKTFTLPDPTSPEPPKTGTTISIVSGSSIYLRGTFAVTGGTAVITPGNLSVTTNVPVPVGPITTPTTYTLTVTNAKGVAVNSQVQIAIPGLADATITTSADPASTLTIGTTGLTASVPAQAGCTYKWSIAGGTAVSAATANTFSFTAGSTVGTVLQLTCDVKNAANTITTGTRSFTLKDTAPTSLTYNPASVSLFNTVPMAAAAVPILLGSAQPGLSTFALAPTSDPLPNGLSLSSSTGAISGTPNEAVSLPHTSHIIVRATNSGGFVDGTLSILVNPAPAFSLSSPTSAGNPAGPGGTVVLTWSVNPSVTSFTITPTVQPTPYTPSTTTGTFNLTAPTATQVYTMTVQPGDFTTTATVHVDAGDITIGSFGPAVVPFGSTQAPITWSITSGVPVTQFVKDPAGTKISGDLSGAARSFTVTNLLPGRQTYTLTAQNDLKSATKTGFVAQRDLYHVAGSYGSGRGTLDGDPDSKGTSTARFYRTQVLTMSDYPADNGAIFAGEYSAHSLRRISSDRKVRTIGGTPGVQGAATDNLVATTMSNPRAVAVDPVTGDVYVSGETYTTRRLLKLARNADGTYTPSVMPNFTLNANGLVIDSNQIMYCVTYSTPNTYLYSMDLKAASPAPTQILDITSVIAANSAGQMAKDFNGGRKLLYIIGTNKIAKVDLAPATPTVSLYAGTGTAGFADSLTATTGTLKTAMAVAVDAKGNLYMSDRDNAAIRMVPAGGTYAGALITVVGKAGTYTTGYQNAAQTLDGGLPTAANTVATIAYPYGITLSSDGSKLYVADAETGLFYTQSVRCVSISGMDANGFPKAGTAFTVEDPANQNYAFAGGPRIYGNMDGLGAVAQFRFSSLATGSLTTGANLATLPGGSKTFVADTGNNLVRIIAADGTVTTMKDTNSNAIIFFSPKGLAAQVDGTGALTALFVADTGTTKKIRRFTPISGQPFFTEDLSFTLTGTFPAAASLNVQGMVVDGTNLYFTDFTANNVYKVDLANANATSVLVTGGSGTPTGIAIQAGATKTLWVAFTGTNQVKSFDLSGGALAIVGVAAGTTPTGAFLDGTAATATFKTPVGLVADGNGYVYVTDTANNAIRVIDTGNSNNVATLVGTPTSTIAPNYYGQRMGLLNSDRTTGDPGNLTGGYVFSPQGISITSTGDLVLTSGNSVYTAVAPANK